MCRETINNLYTSSSVPDQSLTERHSFLVYRLIHVPFTTDYILIGLGF
jgi:hypothetical protein